MFSRVDQKNKKKNKKDYIILLNLDSIPLFPKKPKRKKKKKLLRHIDGNVLSRYMLLVDLYFNPIKQIKYIYIYILSFSLRQKIHIYIRITPKG